MSVYAAEMTRDGDSLVSVYWQDSIGKDMVTFARDGRIVRAFETYSRDRAEGEAQPEEDGLPWEANPRGAMVTLFERIAMFPVTEEWLLRTPRRSWQVVEPPRV